MLAGGLRQKFTNLQQSGLSLVYTAEFEVLLNKNKLAFAFKELHAYLSIVVDAPLSGYCTELQYCVSASHLSFFGHVWSIE